MSVETSAAEPPENIPRTCNPAASTTALPEQQQRSKRSLLSQLYGWIIIWMVTCISLVVFWCSFALSLGYTILFDTWPFIKSLFRQVMGRINGQASEWMRWLQSYRLIGWFIGRIGEHISGSQRAAGGKRQSEQQPRYCYYGGQLLPDMMYSGAAMIVVIITMAARLSILAIDRLRAAATSASTSRPASSTGDRNGSAGIWPGMSDARSAADWDKHYRRSTTATSSGATYRQPTKSTGFSANRGAYHQTFPVGRRRHEGIGGGDGGIESSKARVGSKSPAAKPHLSEIDFNDGSGSLY